MKYNKKFLEKINYVIENLNNIRYVNMKDIDFFYGKDGIDDSDFIYTKCENNNFNKIIRCGDSFVGRDRYLWLKKKVYIPKIDKNLIPIGLFDFGKTGINNKFGFESLLYINGKPYQGIDGNHNDVLFKDYSDKNIILTFLLWTGLEGGGPKKNLKHIIHNAKIGLLNTDINELYYLLKNILDTLIIIEDKNTKEELVEITSTICDSILKDNFSNDSIYKSLKYLKYSLKTIKKNCDVTIYVSGHTHLDVVWLWREKHTREKTQRSFSTVLRLMNEYKDFKFIQSQPQLYKYLKYDNPYISNKIYDAIKKNKWEVDGGMWLEADCNLPSGESLVRQFLYGINYIKKEFNKNCEYLWLPDVFGYSWALPQIMKLFNIKTFMTTKLSWNQTNQMPNDLFYWQGIDGTKILTYFMNIPNNNIRSVKYRKVSNYSAELAPLVAYGSWHRFKNKDLSKDLLISYGFGDGGGGPTRNMIENALAMQKIPGLPNIKFAKPSELFKKLHNNTKDKEVPIWNNELYLELHRGTYTTQAINKKNNRLIENQLFFGEYFDVIRELFDNKNHKIKFNDIWEKTLSLQFHDNIPGSSIEEVYKDSDLIYINLFNKVNEITRNNQNKLLINNNNDYSIYRYSDTNNPELIYINEKRQGYFVDKNNNIIESQKTKNGYLCNVESTSYKPVTIHFINKKIKNESSFNINLKQRMIDSQYYSIKWNKRGFLSSIYDKNLKKELLNGEGNILRCYVNKPKEHDAWDIDIEYLDSYKDAIFDDCQVLENGNLYCAIRFNYHFNKSIIVQDLILYNTNKRIEFKTRVKWKEDHILLRSLFETNVKTSKANYDIQFGHLSRNTTWNNSIDKAKFEVCAHKWMDMSEKTYGISLLNDCKYGHSAMKNTMGITLLNSPKYPNPHADMGKHEFKYALLPHSGKLSTDTIDESLLFNMPSIVFNGKPKTYKQLFIKDNNNIKIDAIKKSENNDGYIVHLHEVLGKEENVTVCSEYKIEKYALCNLLEEYKKVIYKNTIKTKFKPFEIKCFRVWFSRKEDL